MHSDEEAIKHEASEGTKRLEDVESKGAVGLACDCGGADFMERVGVEIKEESHAGEATCGQNDESELLICQPTPKPRPAGVYGHEAAGPTGREAESSSKLDYH